MFVESREITIFAWHCICSARTIVTLALPDPHPSLPHHRWGDSTWQRHDTVTDIDSPTATGRQRAGQASKRSTLQTTWLSDTCTKYNAAINHRTTTVMRLVQWLHLKYNCNKTETKQTQNNVLFQWNCFVSVFFQFSLRCNHCFRESNRSWTCRRHCWILTTTANENCPY